MLTHDEWLDRKNELESLKKKRKEISHKISLLRIAIAQHEKAMNNPPNKTNTFAYQMFGKRLKDLTPEEYKAYYNERQRINRAKKKAKINT